MDPLPAYPYDPLTSWKSWDISHTRQELLCISHLCRSDRKKSRSSGVCVSAWTMQFMKHVLPRLMRPLKPKVEKDRETERPRERENQIMA